LSSSILSRYLDPEALNRIVGRALEPRGLVLGNLAGAHKSPLAGFAVEFAGHREYVPGDDVKHIDWRVYFTRQRYFVKQYEMETNLTCHFVLDTSASMRYGEEQHQKLRYASRMLATLGYAVLRQSDKVSLTTYDTQIRAFLPPSNSMAQIISMTGQLDEIDATDQTETARCLAEVATRLKRREIVMIFSDLFGDVDALEEALQRLRYHRHEVVLFQVLHHDELDFPLEGTTRFVGLETAEHLLTDPQAIRRAYLAALERFDQKLQQVCQRNRVERVVVDTNRDMGEVLIDYLNRRSRLHRRR
jgi:uncharacterized protein (DUF58 family)